MFLEDSNTSVFRLLDEDIINFNTYPKAVYGDILYEVEAGNKWGFYFSYPQNNQDYTLEMGTVNMSIIHNSSTPFSYSFTKYKEGANEDVYGVCEVKSQNAFFDGERNLILEAGSTLNSLQTSSGQEIIDFELADEEKQLISKYYYMKAFAYLEISGDLTLQRVIVPFENENNSQYSYSTSSYNAGRPHVSTVSQILGVRPDFTSSELDSDSDGRVPFIYLKDKLDFFKLERESLREGIEKLKLKCGSNCGDLTFKVTIIPIDGKCDFNSDGVVNQTSEFVANFTSSLSLPTPAKMSCEDNPTQSICTSVEKIITPLKTKSDLDTDADAIIDKYEFAQCVGEKGKLFFGGCAEPIGVTESFKANSCSKDAKFRNYYGRDVFYCAWDWEDLFSKDALIKYNSADVGDSTSGSLVMKDFRIELTSADNDGYYSCVEDSSILGTYFRGKCEVEKVSSIQLPPHKMYDKFRDMEVNAIKKTVALNDPTKKGNQLIYDYNQKEYYFQDISGNLVEVSSLSQASQLVDVYSNSGFATKEILSSDEYVLDAFKIRPFSSASELRSFIETSNKVLENATITKNVSSDSTSRTKEVKLSLKNLSTTAPTTLYLIFEKDVPIEQIIPKNSTGTFFIQEKDPIIGWYFEDGTGDENVSYEVPENANEGTIVITQEPILYNEGDLIVNYRNTACNPDEVELFQLDSLEDSNMYVGGDHNFKVCLGHVDEQPGDLGEYSNSFVMGNVTGSNHFTLNKSGASIGASFNKPISLNYIWDLKVQEENPDGTYSCVGSYRDASQTLFGDCSYNPENRMWIHFGEDTIAPQSSIDIPFLSHTIYIDVGVKEEPIYGADLKKVSYCITSADSTCDPYTSEVKALSGDSAQFRLQETCPNDWGCRKTLRISAEDTFGNVESIKEFDLNIIDKGSSCQSSCLSVPSPDRYLKECRNLNGCEYYNYQGDGGKKVANLCDLKIQDTWVKFNESYDIKCPNGPLRPTQFTQKPLEITSIQCRATRTIPYPIVLNGESLIMNIVSCIE